MSIQDYIHKIEEEKKSEAENSIFTPEKKTDVQDMSMSMQDYIHIIEKEKKSGAENSIFIAEKKTDEEISSDEYALIFTPKKKTNPDDPDPCPPRPLSIQYFSMTIKKGNKSETSTSNIIPSIFTPEKKTDVQDLSMSIQDYIHKIEEEKNSGAENSIFTPEKKTDVQDMSMSMQDYIHIIKKEKKSGAENSIFSPEKKTDVQDMSMSIQDYIHIIEEEKKSGAENSFTNFLQKAAEFNICIQQPSADEPYIVLGQYDVPIYEVPPTNHEEVMAASEHAE
jgi:hypothetical protein